MRRFDDSSARTVSQGYCNLLFLLISFVILQAGVVAAEADGNEVSDSSLQSVRLQLRWKHQFQFAGYYAAVEKGYYREAGLDVRLLEGDTNTEPVDVVLSGAADYGIDDSRTLLARLQGRPVVALAAIFQHSPQVLLVRADSGIRTPHDLAGHKVSITRKRSGAEFPVMFLREGVNLEKILVVSSTTGVEDLAAGRTDAIVGYLSNEVYRLKRMGIDTVAINPVNYGVDYYGDLLFTSEVEVDSHPQRVEAMREAASRGRGVDDTLVKLFSAGYAFYKSRLPLARAAFGVSWLPEQGQELRELAPVQLIQELFNDALVQGVERGELSQEAEVKLRSQMLFDCYLANFQEAIFGGWSLDALQAKSKDQIRVILAGARRG